MSTQPTTCTCDTCPGASCTCGCQHTAPVSAAACQCGAGCSCGPACRCGA